VAGGIGVDFIAIVRRGESKPGVLFFLTVMCEHGRRGLDAANGRYEAFSCECSYLYVQGVAVVRGMLRLVGLRNKAELFKRALPSRFAAANGNEE